MKKYLESYFQNLNDNNNNNNDYDDDDMNGMEEDAEKEIELMDILLNRIDSSKNRKNPNNININSNNNNNNRKSYILNDYDTNTNLNGEFDLLDLIQSNNNNKVAATSDNENKLENPFYVNQRQTQGLSKLFSNGGGGGSVISAEQKFLIDSDFNTDTKIQMLGGLTLWQFTAIIIIILVFLGSNKLIILFTYL